MPSGLFLLHVQSGIDPLYRGPFLNFFVLFFWNISIAQYKKIQLSYSSFQESAKKVGIYELRR